MSPVKAPCGCFESTRPGKSGTALEIGDRPRFLGCMPCAPPSQNPCVVRATAVRPPLSFCALRLRIAARRAGSVAESTAVGGPKTCSAEIAEIAEIGGNRGQKSGTDHVFWRKSGTDHVFSRRNRQKSGTRNRGQTTFSRGRDESRPYAVMPAAHLRRHSAPCASALLRAG